MRLTDVPIERPVATLMLLLSLTVLGTVAMFLLPLDFMPVIKEPEVDVEVPYAGSHPLETLREISLPIEEEIASIPGVKRIRSFSGSGSANINADFEWSSDIDLKRMEVKEAVERARPRLPRDVGHITVEGDTGGPGNAILSGRISADRNLSESWDLLDRRIRRPLERIKGVARVYLYGVAPQQVRVDFDLDALKRHGVNPGELLAVFNQANVEMDLGAVREPALVVNARFASRFGDVNTIRELPVGRGGLRVKDVARVEMREPRLEYGRHLDRKFAVGIDVFRDPTANTVETVDRLMEKIDEVRSDPQLAGIQLLVWENAGREIRHAVHGLRNAGLFGGLLAVVVLYLFLRSVRTTLVVAVSIPFSLLVTCGFLYFLDFQLNVLTMTGLMLGVGMLVDNAVVVMENIVRLKSEGMAKRPAACEGAAEVAMAVIASTATTIIVWSWLFAAERDSMVIMMKEVAVPICLSVVCSLLISLTFIPMCAARIRPGRESRPGVLVRRVLPAYRSLLSWTLRHRFATLAVLVLLAATAAIPIAKIEKSGEPRMRAVQVPIVYRVHDPATKEVMEGYVNQVEAWLESNKQRLGYENVYSFFSESESAMTLVYVPERKATEQEVARLRATLKEGLPRVAGVSLEVGDREWWRHDRQQRGTVTVAIHGEDPEYLEKLAVQVEERLRGTKGTVDVYGPSVRGQKEVRVVVDPERARSLDVTPQDVARVVAFTFRGQPLRRFHGPNGELDMVTGLPEEAKPGLAALAVLPIPRPGRDSVPLGSVAEITLARTPPTIMRMDRKTTMGVTVEMADKAGVPEVRERISERLSGMKLPEGYSWDWGSAGHERDENLGVMLYGVLLALAVVLLLMAGLFESILQPLSILVTLPLAFFGVFWVLWLFGFELDVVAFMGVIILIGIVVNNGIVMVDHVNGLRRGGMERVPAMLQGCADRLRPVLMTALTTLIGLVPLAFSGATVANAYIDSLALGVIGGLATSTLFTLLALPVWYTMVEDTGTLLGRLLPLKRSRAATTPDGA